MSEKLTLETIVKDIDKLAEEMKIKATEGLSKIFEIYPEVDAVCWNQYTPGFNDGDACVNSIGEIYILKGKVTQELIQEIANNPYYPEDYDSEDELWKDVEILDYTEGSAEQITKFINTIEDELERIYDTNSSIVMSRNFGTIVEEYDCGY